MKSPTAVVVIPVYKTIADEEETRSLVQCLRVLHAYPLIFVCAENLDTSFYRNACEKNSFAGFSFITFDDHYFQSIAGYCRLLLSGKFYSKFEQFDYILLYQLDAWVFKDELTEWCQKKFDYIGAPWFVGQDKSTPDAGFMKYSGNGGFSLRKISSFLKVIHTYKIIKTPAEIVKEYAHMGLVKRFIRLPVIILRMLGWRNNSTYYRNHYTLNEDNYWAFLAHEVYPEFTPATAQQAIAFAFETHPAKMYELNNRQLPFGCHAWYKLGNDFWKPFLS